MPRRRLLITLFALYLVLLAWIILWKLEVPWIGEAAGLPRPFKLVPFVANGDAGASKPLEVVVNLLLFVPFGAYLRLFVPSWLWRAVGIFAAASLALEVTQHLISIGSFDVTDVIVNTAGGAVGLVLARLVTPAVLARILVIGGAIAVLAVALFIASPLHYGPQHDVVVRDQA